MAVAEPDPRIEQKQLPCGCAQVFVVQQENQCAHNDGRYPIGDLDLEWTPCGCCGEYDCSRCNGHGYVCKKRQRA